MTSPILTQHDGVWVVRDDLFKGGTKARFFPQAFEGVDELVYASPPEGGAQTALAHVARDLGKRATIFVAKRMQPHPRSLEAKRLGGKVLQIDPGYMSVVRARARGYCTATGAKLLPFGIDLPAAIECFAAAAGKIEYKPAEVWCAAGSGVLSRALAIAFPDARRHAVQIGRRLTPPEVGWAEIHVHPLRFEQRCRIKPPFPSDAHYDAKAWEMMIEHGASGDVLFWNVTGDLNG